jgi:phosphatidylethanolamine/phosphatidyl-N-methylethanolamine N-methyltransferase
VFEFLTQALRDFRHTGSVWPSSPILARAMTKSIARIQGPRRVLEVGPGTGPFTKAILKKLRTGDQFDLVEINELFCRKLEREVLSKYRAAHPAVDVRLHCAPIEDAELSGPYDVIVCGLPFNNFPPKLMRQIFRRMFSLLKEDGELVYFEYVGVRAVKRPVVDGAARARLRRIDMIGKSLRRKHDGRTELVLGNFPPALAYSLKAAKPKARRATSARARTPRARG